MKIKSIFLKNIKGMTDEIHLGTGKSAFITGDNMAGKTAVIDAVELALLGSHSIGKSGAALAKFASDAEMIAQVTFQDGTKSTLEVNAVKPIKIKHSPAIDVPDFLIRPSAFRSMKKADQVAHVADLLGNTMAAAEVQGIMEEVIEGTGNQDVVKQYKESTAIVDGAVDFDLPGAIPKVVKDLDRIRQLENSLALQLEKQAAVEMPGEAIPQAMIDALEAKRADLIDKSTELASLASDSKTAWAAFHRAQTERDRIYEMLTDAEEGPKVDPAELDKVRKDLENYRADASDMIKTMRENTGGRAALEAILGTIDEPGPCPICQNEAPNWRQTARNTIQGKIDSIDVQNATLTERLAETKVEGKALAEKAARLEAPVPNADKAQKRLEEIDAMPKPEGDPDALGAKLKDLNQVIDKTGLEIADLKFKRNKRIEVRQAGDKAAIHRGAAGLAKAMVDAISAKDQERVQKKMGSILALANQVAGEILPGPLSWDNAGLSYTTANGARIDADTWSGTEDLLGRIAWAVAIATDSPLKLVILDEFGRLSWSNQTKVLAHLLSLVEAGTLDQVIAVSSGPCPLDDVAGLVEIQIGKPDPVRVYGTDGSIAAMIHGATTHPGSIETAEGVIGETPTPPPGTTEEPPALNQASDQAKAPETASQAPPGNEIPGLSPRWRTMVTILTELRAEYGAKKVPNARQLRTLFAKHNVRKESGDGAAVYYDMDAAIAAFKASKK